MYTDEMMHAATKIMQNRADQLGLDDDELMHYGRKGMKWGKDIFATDPNSTKKAVYGFMDVVTGADKRKQDQENKQHDADFILNRAKFDRELQLKQKRNELYEKPREFQKAINNSDHARLGRIFGTNQYLTEGINRSNPDLTRDLAEGRNVKVEGGYVLPKDKDNPYYHTITDEEKANIDYNNQLETNKQDAIEKYSDNNDEFTDEDRAKGQEVRMKQRGHAVREAQKQQRQEELAKKKQELLEKARKEKAQRTKGLFSPDVTREHQQAMVPVREGKAGEILENSYGPDNTVFKTDAKNQSRVNFDRYKKQHNAR